VEFGFHFLSATKDFRNKKAQKSTKKHNKAQNSMIKHDYATEQTILGTKKHRQTQISRIESDYLFSSSPVSNRFRIFPALLFPARLLFIAAVGFL